ncbi:hypothetical protein TNCV_4076971 [Trichonephila clavipes]|nr:hypothetical protein TNCV_4076971 [Trichonephila clavipes]
MVFLPSPQPLPIKSSHKTDICAPISITAFIDVCTHLISTNQRSSIPFFVLMGTETGIETLAVTTSLPLLVPMFDSIGNLAFQKNGASFGRRLAPLLSETNLLFVGLYLESFEWAPLTLAITLSYSSSLSSSRQEQLIKPGCRQTILLRHQGHVVSTEL